MKKLGMWAAVRAIPPVMGAIFNRAHGDRSYDMPPLRMIQDSGIHWGFHTDTTEVNQYKPFVTLWFAVTGKMQKLQLPSTARKEGKRFCKKIVDAACALASAHHKDGRTSGFEAQRSAAGCGVA